MSFDVPKHSHRPIEIYGTEGSLLVPDPNRFGGEVEIGKAARRLGATVRSPTAYADGNFRSIGVADMADAHPQRTGRTAPAARSPSMCSR